jgi:hypothetical protein
MTGAKVSPRLQRFKVQGRKSRLRKIEQARGPGNSGASDVLQETAQPLSQFGRRLRRPSGFRTCRRRGRPRRGNSRRPGATVLMNPAGLGGAGRRLQTCLGAPVASADLPAGKQRQQVADAGEVEARLADQAEHGGNPGIIESGEVSRPLRRLQRNQHPLAFVEAKQVDGDAEVLGPPRQS